MSLFGLGFRSGLVRERRFGQESCHDRSRPPAPFRTARATNGIVTQVQLVAAFQAWTLDKSRSLADHLEAHGNLTGKRRCSWNNWPTFILKHTAAKSIKALRPSPAKHPPRAGLAELGGPEIESSFARTGGSRISCSTMLMTIGPQASVGGCDQRRPAVPHLAAACARRAGRRVRGAR